MLNWLLKKRQMISEVVSRFSATPVQAATTFVEQANFLVIDLELTGLNPKKDHIVSIGWVLIQQQEIVLGKA